MKSYLQSALYIIILLLNFKTNYAQFTFRGDTVILKHGDTAAGKVTYDPAHGKYDWVEFKIPGANEKVFLSASQLRAFWKSNGTKCYSLEIQYPARLSENDEYRYTFKRKGGLAWRFVKQIYMGQLIQLYGVEDPNWRFFYKMASRGALTELVLLSEITPTSEFETEDRDEYKGQLETICAFYKVKGMEQHIRNTEYDEQALVDLIKKIDTALFYAVDNIPPIPFAKRPHGYVFLNGNLALLRSATPPANFDALHDRGGGVAIGYGRYHAIKALKRIFSIRTEFQIHITGFHDYIQHDMVRPYEYPAGAPTIFDLRVGALIEMAPFKSGRLRPELSIGALGVCEFGSMDKYDAKLAPNLENGMAMIKQFRLAPTARLMIPVDDMIFLGVGAVYEPKSIFTAGRWGNISTFFARMQVDLIR